MELGQAVDVPDGDALRPDAGERGDERQAEVGPFEGPPQGAQRLRIEAGQAVDQQDVGALGLHDGEDPRRVVGPVRGRRPLGAGVDGRDDGQPQLVGAREGAGEPG